MGPQFWLSSSVPARRRRVRHGVELCDPGLAEHQAHARAAGPLSSESSGEPFTLFVNLFIRNESALQMTPAWKGLYPRERIFLLFFIFCCLKKDNSLGGTSPGSEGLFKCKYRGSPIAKTLNSIRTKGFSLFSSSSFLLLLSSPPPFPPSSSNGIMDSIGTAVRVWLNDIVNWGRAGKATGKFHRIANFTIWAPEKGSKVLV